MQVGTGFFLLFLYNEVPSENLGPLDKVWEKGEQNGYVWLAYTLP